MAQILFSNDTVLDPVVRKGDERSERVRKLRRLLKRKKKVRRGGKKKERDVPVMRRLSDSKKRHTPMS